MRRVSLLLGLGVAALAQGTALDRGADEALAAARRGDAGALGALARGQEPGGWLLAHELCARGEHEAAARLAGAARGKDFERLPEYVEARRGAGDDAPARQALRLFTESFARQDMKGALAAADSVPLDRDTAVTVALGAGRGRALLELDRLPEGADALRAAGEAAARLGDLRAAAAALDLCALVAHKALGPATAAAAERQLAAVERARGDEEGLAECLLRLQHACQRLGDVESLAKTLDELVPLVEAGGAATDLAETLARAAVAHVRLGHYARAEQLAERALAVAWKAGNDTTTGNVLLSVASVQGVLRQPEKALASQLRAVDLLERGPPGSLAMALVTAGKSCISLRRYDDAIAHLERARPLCTGQMGPMLATVLSDLGTACIEKGEDRRGLALLEQGIAVAEQAGAPQLLALSLLSAGSALLGAEEYGKALPLLERATEAAAKAGSRDYVVSAEWQKAACLLATGKPREALEGVDRCVAIIAEVYRGLGEQQGAQARSQDAFVFRLGALAALDLGDAARAFRYLETGRAGSLLESLGGRSAASRFALPEALRAREAEARSAAMLAEALHAEAQRARDLKAAQARRKELDAARDALNDAIQAIQREAKAAAPLLYPEAASLDQVQGILAEDEALVVFDLPRKAPAGRRSPAFARRTMAMVVTRNEARMVGLPPADAIVLACDGLALDDTEEDPSPRIAEIRKLVIEPLALPPKAKRILVSVSGALSPVPLCLLLPDRTVAYVPSATTYRLLREGGSARGKKVLALGDPRYEGALKPLPHTRAEAKEIGDTVLLGHEATKEGLSAALAREERWRAVHLACHGLVDEERPALSSLALTGGGLSAHEAMAMRFPADLVVLSACETGKGKVIAGEGLFGLSRAFMVAGAPRVVVSLWPVEDKATLALMKRFHEAWKRGTPAAQALREAQDHVRAKKEWAHPAYWAAWQVWGLPD